MIKKILSMFLVLLIPIIFLTACSKMSFSEDFSNEYSVFVLVEKGNCYNVVYHKDTLVMYVISFGAYNSGNFSVLLDAEGKPLLYKNC